MDADSVSPAIPKILQELQGLIEKEGRRSCFAFGGKIPVKQFPVDFICDSDEAKSTKEDSSIEGGPDTGSQLLSAGKEGIDNDAENKGKPSKLASVKPHYVDEAEDHHIKCEPVIIRYESPKDGRMSRLKFPIDDLEVPLLKDFVQSCEPASFGRDGQDVFDESYRKAGKLDRSEFSSNFDPYSLGIIDSITQVLLPSWIEDKSKVTQVRAELYKLNVSPF